MNHKKQLEMWGGVECTINRVGDEYSNQCERSGHAHRISDLDLFASLGIRTLRYPLLWEHLAPASLDDIDWSWADERITRLRELGIRPIAGLTHHGSGPRHTHLADPAFATGLAEYAARVAERFPDIAMWTPVNEPLTTARFSGLYGHWFPHGRDEHTFVRCLVNQCKGVALAMQAIRHVNPQAQLVQTEDLGLMRSTPRLKYQADFENERRWISLDLLCGRVTRDHPLRQMLLDWGAQELELEWFEANACPPDILGINHYVTSDRFLDENANRYPEWTHARNFHDHYADLEAVRVYPRRSADISTMLREAWHRYGLPLAVTEAQLTCTREEQVRWLHDVWTGAHRVLDEGVDVRAVTSWALLGAFDWHCLATRCENHYEPNAFDLRAPRPRQTAIARAIKNYATRGTHDHAVLDVPGWWNRPSRLIYDENRQNDSEFLAEHCADARPILITGASGTLGQALSRVCQARALPFRLLSRHEMDIADSDHVERVVDELQPWAIINAAGYARVDDAERDREHCFRENTIAPTALAASCARHDVQLVNFSSNLVFGNDENRARVESDTKNPLSVYGQSKAQMEDRVLDVLPESLIIRTSAFFGPWEECSFAFRVLRSLSCGEEIVACADEIVTPTFLPDLAHRTLDLLIDGECGVWHLANDGAVSWAEWARRIARRARLDTRLIVAKPMKLLSRPALRPRCSALKSERAWLMPSLDDALQRFLDEHPFAQSLRDATKAKIELDRAA